MCNLKKNREKDVIKKINKNLSSINSHCEIIIKKYQNHSEMSHKDYIYFVLSLDVLYRIKDIIFLNKKLKKTKNSFDSSLYTLTRSVVESFIYMKYLLSEENNITMRLHAFICHSTKNNELKILNSIKALGERRKFIFSEDPQSVLSLVMINSKTTEWENDINERKDFYRSSEAIFNEEIRILKSIEDVAKKYDEIMGITFVINGEENKSMEWMYNYVYRFQCMSAHQSLRDKEKVFKLYSGKKEEPNNIAILGLLEDLSAEIATLCI